MTRNLSRIIIPDFSCPPQVGEEKSAPSGSEGALGQIRRESDLCSEVSQILPLHKKVHEKNPGYPAKRLNTPSGFFAAALRANFAITKFGIIRIICIPILVCFFINSSLPVAYAIPSECKIMPQLRTAKWESRGEKMSVTLDTPLKDYPGFGQNIGALEKIRNAGNLKNICSLMIANVANNTLNPNADEGYKSLAKFFHEAYISAYKSAYAELQNNFSPQEIADIAVNRIVLATEKYFAQQNAVQALAAQPAPQALAQAEAIVAAAEARKEATTAAISASAVKFLEKMQQESATMAVQRQPVQPANVKFAKTWLGVEKKITEGKFKGSPIYLVDGVEYEIKEKLAGGTQSDVFLAEGKGKNGIVNKIVIKLPIPGGDKYAAQNFSQDVKMCRELQEYNLNETADILFAGEIGGVECIITKYLDENEGWVNLENKNPNGLTAKEFIESVYIDYKIAQALARVHEKGITIGDLKPGNIFYNTKTGEVKFIDFGMSSSNRNPYGPYWPAGGPYGSLEQRRASIGKRYGTQFSQQTDLYSAVAILCRLIQGKDDFEGDEGVGSPNQRSTEESKKEYRSYIEKKLREIGIDEATQKILLDALTKRFDETPGKRGTASGLASDIEDAIGSMTDPLSAQRQSVVVGAGVGGAINGAL